MKKIIAYKQGNQWILNIDSNLMACPYYIRTKKEVKQYVVSRSLDMWAHNLYKITFA